MTPEGKPESVDTASAHDILSSNYIKFSGNLDLPLYRTDSKWDSPQSLPTVATYIPLEFLSVKKGHFHSGRKGQLLLHRSIIRARIKEFPIEFLKDILKRVATSISNEIKETQKSGHLYDYYGIKETRGESIGIYVDKKTGQITLQLITHKLKRLEAYRKLLIDLNIKQVDWTFEVYVRYHYIYESRIAQILNALRKQYGKSQRWEIHNHSGRDIHYLVRVRGIDHQGAEIHVKSYRSKHYSRYSPNHPEHHPKLEQETRLKNISPQFISVETITQYSIIINTVIRAARIKTIIIGDYEKQCDTIEATVYSEKMRKTLRAVNKRIKANNLLEQDIKDIRIAVAKLLVDKRMRQVDIARALGYSYRHIKRIVEELVDKGIIKRVKRGQYEWADKKNLTQEEHKVIHKYYDTLEQLLNDIKNIKHFMILQLKPQLVITYKEEVKYTVITNIYVDNDYTIIKTKDKRILGYKISPTKLQELILEPRRWSLSNLSAMLVNFY